MPAPKTVISFKKILLPDGLDVNKKADTKIAFLGLTNCDALALDLFIEEFESVDVIPERKNILVVSVSCQPDKFCFCGAFSTKIDKFDLHLQTSKEGSLIFAGSTLGRKILKMTGITESKGEISPAPNKQTKINPKILITAIENRDKFANFWQGIANNCFGCGACTAVCPLCFCTRKNFDNDLEGGSSHLLCQDSCFSSSFSEIQHHTNYRPENVDRLYNWYHHKFVRAPRERGHFLCTGCGRCIEACPANLNQYRIIGSAIKQEENDKK